MTHFKIFISLILVGFCFSCTDLEEQYLDSFADERLSLRQPVPATKVSSSLNDLRTAYASQDNFFALLTHPADDFMGPTRGGDWDDNGRWRNLHNHSFPADNDQLLNGFNQIIKIISTTNSEIVNAANQVVVDKARVHRAFAVFMVADMWGGVPFRDDKTVDFLEPPKILSRQEAITFAISELEAALPSLPNKGGDGYVYGEPTKDVARAILAKIYLNKFVYDGLQTPPASDMDKVIEYANAIESNGYVLANNYFVDNFGTANDKSPEAIFSIPITTTNKGNMRSRFQQQMHYNHPGNLGGWNGFVTLADFYNTFDSDDPRRYTEVASVKTKYGVNNGFLIGQQKDASGTNLKDRSGNLLAYTPEVSLTNSNEVQGIRVLKYVPNNPDDANPLNDLHIIRYADVMLMKAEALWRKGDNAQAITLINTLRNKRGLDASKNISSISADGIEIFNERGFELYNEGWRRNDQIRFGKWLQAWEAKPVQQASANLFPYPQVAIDANPNLSQNPGY